MKSKQFPALAGKTSFVSVAGVAPLTTDSVSLTTLVIQPLMVRSLETGVCTWVPELAK